MSVAIPLPVRLRAQEMFAQGVRSTEIAAELRVNVSTVRNWKRAASCTDCGTPLGDAGQARCVDCAAVAATVWTRDVLLARIQEFADRYGAPPGALDWNPALARANNQPERAERFYADGFWPHVGTVAAVFGSLNAAVEAAGFAPRKCGLRRDMRGWSAEEIIAAIRAWADEHGSPPGCNAWVHSGGDEHPGHSPVLRAFGSWNAAIRAAGFEPRRPGGQGSVLYRSPRAVTREAVSPTEGMRPSVA